MKLIIQIPCFNESDSLPIMLSHLPRKVKGFKEVKWLLINDGSDDDSVEVAKEMGVDYIISFKKNQGLAKTFKAGIDYSIEHGADVIVNIDADNQYNAEDIPKLVEPILNGKADFVIGSRPIGEMGNFSNMKKTLQRLGSWAVRKISKTDIPDAPSGFRAMSADAATKFNIFNNYTYTIETIIQAGLKNMAITYVPIRVNDDLRASKLVKNIFSYIFKSIATMIRIFIIYKPFRFFISIGIALFMIGFLLGVRYLIFLFIGLGSGHIQSVILSAILLGMGFQTALVAFIADLLSVNRQILENLQYRIKKLRSHNQK